MRSHSIVLILRTTLEPGYVRTLLGTRVDEFIDDDPDLAHRFVVTERTILTLDRRTRRISSPTGEASVLPATIGLLTTLAAGDGVVDWPTIADDIGVETPDAVRTRVRRARRDLAPLAVHPIITVPGAGYRWDDLYTLMEPR